MKTATITGTNHFIDIHAAVSYYSLQGFGLKDVLNKLADKEIELGSPGVKEGRKITVQRGRYFIEE